MRNFISFLFYVYLLFIIGCGVFSETEKKLPSDNRANTHFDNRNVGKIIETARSKTGAPYLFGGTGNGGFDCSGLVTVAFQSVGAKLPRSSADMAQVGRELNIRDLRAGDLVFFKTGTTDRINHVGIVTGRRSDGSIWFIHAADSGVREDNLGQNYYQKTFIKATRTLD